MPGTTFLRPELVSAYRKTPGTPGLDGNITPTVALTYSDLPALIDHAARGVSDKLEYVDPTGQMVNQTDLCFVDGLMPYQFVGYTAGETVTVNGIAYIVNSEATGAFVDIQPFDVVVHGTNRYLVLQATPYVLVEPCIQLHLNFGRAWMETP